MSLEVSFVQQTQLVPSRTPCPIHAALYPSKERLLHPPRLFCEWCLFGSVLLALLEGRGQVGGPVAPPPLTQGDP